MNARAPYAPAALEKIKRARSLMKPGNATPEGMSLREVAAHLHVETLALDLALWRNLGRRN